MGEYIISRGFQEGKNLTLAQRSSALFSEEPVVLGRVLRRGSRPLRLATADYKANEAKLLALENAGAIKIQRPKQQKEEDMPAPVPCSLCGQVPCGQGGEYKCTQCGLPMVHDPAQLNPQGAGDAPVPQEAAGAPTPEAAAPPAPPEVIVPPPPPAPEPSPAPPAEEPPPPAPEPVPAPVEEKKEEVPAPPPSAPKSESKSSKRKSGSSK